MTNQAAQTMPPLPDRVDLYSTTTGRGWGYTADQMHQYARDYAAMLAAAPAASGTHPDALPDGTLSKSTVKRVDALAAASVSERAREWFDAYDNAVSDLFADEETGWNEGNRRHWMRRRIDRLRSILIAALEQALTQQRGAPVFDRAWVVRDAELRAAAYNLMNLVEGVGCERWQNANGFRLKDTQQWVEFYIATKNVQSFGEVTTPQPSADAVRDIYDAAAKGFHTSETNGAERKYLHVIRFQSIEDLHGYEDAWTAAMVKARDAK